MLGYLKGLKYVVLFSTIDQLLLIQQIFNG